jgi:4-alpha-glucanotransferase
MNRPVHKIEEELESERTSEPPDAMLNELSEDPSKELSGIHGTGINTQSPFWTKLGGNGKVAGLDIHDVRCIGADYKEESDIEDMYTLVDQCSETGIALIAMNPISDSGDNACPYCGIAGISYNPAHIGRNKIPGLNPVTEGLQELLEARTKQRAEEDQKLFNHKNTRDFKLGLLRLGYDHMDSEEFKEFHTWKKNCSKGLWDYAVFCALKEKLGSDDWANWPEKFKNTSSRQIYDATPDLKEEISFVLYTQWVSETHWVDLKKYAEAKGVYMSLDKPIYPQVNSADVWANRELFYMYGDENPDKKDRPSYTSGVNVPGDPYGAQSWGHAVFKFKEKPEEVIDFIVEIVRHMAKISSVIRLDHVLALVWKYFKIPAESDAITGQYVKALKHKILGRLRKEFPDVYFYAEDVGYVSEEEVDRPLREEGMPGMRAAILDARELRYNNIAGYPAESCAITDNHDTETLPVWWEKLKEEEKRNFLRQMYGDQFPAEKLSEPLNIPDFIRMVFRAKSKLAITTLRAVTRDTRRHNVPGVSAYEDPTLWQVMANQQLEEINWQSLSEIIKETGRSAMKVAEDTREVLATNPTLMELPRRKAGESLEFSIGTTSRPTQIIIYTNINGEWETRELEDATGDYEVIEYKDGIKVCKIKLSIPETTKPGIYEYSGTIVFEDDTEVNLTKAGENFQVKVLGKSEEE